MSEFNNLDDLVKNKSDAGDMLSDEEQSIDENEKIDDDDISSNDDESMGFESDMDNIDGDEDIDTGFDEDITAESTFKANIDDDASVSSFGSELSENDENNDYFQKFNNKIRQDIISEYHPESSQVNYEEVNTLSKIVRNNEGKIIDPFHNTIPILTKFEKTRVLGLRAKQINEGAKPFVEINQDNYDGYVIASKELQQKKIPFIIRRPLPNGASEYWKLSDLEVI